MASDGTKQLRPIFLYHVREHRGGLIIALTCLLGVMLAGLLAPWPLKLIFDNILLERPFSPGFAFLEPLLSSGKMQAVVILALTVVLIESVGSGLAYWQTVLGAKIGYQLTHRLRTELFSRLQQLSLSFHHQNKSGELLTKISNDTAKLKELLAEWGLVMVTQLLTILGMIVIMLIMNWMLCLVALAFLPVLALLVVRIKRKVKKSVRLQRHLEGEIASSVSEVLSSITLVQAFGRGSFEQERFENISERSLATGVQTARVSSALVRVVSPISSAAIAGTLIVGSLEVIQGRMTPGDLLVFIAYVSSLYKPVRQIGRLWGRFAEVQISMERIARVLALQPDIRDRPDAIDAQRLKGDIVFQDVSFTYRDGVRAIDSMSFHVTPGQRVAIVGASGAGKSTLISLLLRLYDPQQGAVYIDGVDVRRYQRESLREEIGIALQDTFLFGATIAENLSYGKPGVSKAEVVEAAGRAHADEFIGRLPEGYDTVVGEHGVLLSGGQRQRLCLARALIKKPSILVLDEPTAAVDTLSERLIQESVKQTHGGKTLLVITHRYTAMQTYDRILVLADGKLIENGSHQELLGLQGHYCELVQRQVA